MYAFDGRSFSVDIVKGSARLAKLRGNKSINTVSEETEISCQSLRNYEEAGKDNPVGKRKSEFAGMSVDTLCKLSQYYGVSPEYILGISDKQNPSVKVREISKYTGLSEDAVQTAHVLNGKNGIKNSEYYMKAVSILLESGLDGLAILDAIAEYIRIAPSNTYQLITQSPDGVEIKEKYDASYLLLKDIEEHLRAIREGRR